MKACGIVAEYNPFHNGHLYHLKRSYELSGADVLICVMSGNFTERGELALTDKWTRAENAVKCGVNLVVEMPTVFTLGGAGYFSKAGIEILEALMASNVSFGIESEPEGVMEAVRVLKEHEEFIENEIRKRVKLGLSYPRAREEAVNLLAGNKFGEVLSKPNNILAIEYLKNIKRAEPVLIERKGTGYSENEASGSFASAKLIRKMLLSGENTDNYVPQETKEMLSKNKLADNELFFRLFIKNSLMLTAEEMNSAFGAEEGLGNIIKRDFRRWTCYNDMIASLKSKRYTDTRIRRTLAGILLGITKNDIKTAKNYIRVLAFDEKGARYLRQIKKSKDTDLPIITNINKAKTETPEIAETLEFDIKASDFYNAASDKALYENSDYLRTPVKIQR